MTSRFAPDQDPRHAEMVGKSRAGDDYGHPERGSVADTGRWFSIRWWVGHHWKRRRDGEFAADAPSWVADEPHPLVAARMQRRGRESTRLARDYRAYLEAQYDAAEHATGGHMVNAAGRRRGVSPRSAWFAGRRGSTAYASDEMRDWLAGHRVLTNAEFRAQQAGPTHTIRTRSGASVQARIVRRSSRTAAA